MQIDNIVLGKDVYRLWICIFLVGIFSYGFSIFNFNLGIDTEFVLSGGIHDYLISFSTINRWAMWIYYYLLLPGVFFPYIGGIIALTALSFAYSIYASNHKSLDFSARLIFGALAISFPTFGMMLYFGFMIAQVSCSAALTIFAYLLARDGKTIVTGYVLPIVFSTFGLFTYQSLLLIVPALYLIDALLIDAPLLARSRYEPIPRLVIMCLSSIIIYYSGSELLHIITGILQSNYSENFSVWSSHGIIDGLASVYNHLVFRLNSTAMAPTWLVIIPVFIIVLSSKYKVVNIVILFFIVLFVLFPFFGMGILLPIRAWFFVPIIFAGCFVGAFKQLHSRSRFIFILLCFITLCFNSSINTKLMLADSLANQRDQIIAERIYNSIYDIAGGQLHQIKNSLVISTVDLDPVLPKIVYRIQEGPGASFFSWGKETSRIRAYMCVLGIPLPPTLTDTNKEQQIRSMENVRNMPTYPEKGFVQVVGDVLVVKMNSDMQ